MTTKQTEMIHLNIGRLRGIAEFTGNEKLAAVLSGIANDLQGVVSYYNHGSDCRKASNRDLLALEMKSVGYVPDKPKKRMGRPPSKFQCALCGQIKPKDEATLIDDPSGGMEMIKVCIGCAEKIENDEPKVAVI